APRAADNRTGLGLLVELARSWPRSARRLEARFLAVGALADAVAMAREWADPPTLVLMLEAPGVGATIGLAGREGAVAEASQIAGDLWAPARRQRWRDPALADFTRIAGMTGFAVTGSNDRGAIEPATLQAAGQLCLEAALRWAKRHAPAGD